MKMFAVVTDQKTPRPETARCHIHASTLFSSGNQVRDCSEDLTLVCQVCGVGRHNENDPIYQSRPAYEAIPTEYL